MFFSEFKSIAANLGFICNDTDVCFQIERSTEKIAFLDNTGKLRLREPAWLPPHVYVPGQMPRFYERFTTVFSTMNANGETLAILPIDEIRTQQILSSPGDVINWLSTFGAWNIAFLKKNRKKLIDEL